MANNLLPVAIIAASVQSLRDAKQGVNAPAGKGIASANMGSFHWP
jgi:hypothetical protein